MARRLPGHHRLWDAIGAAGAGTRSVSASTPVTRGPVANDLSTMVDRILAITGRVDFVHANDNSRDTFDSGADRHTNFGSGEIDGSEVSDYWSARLVAPWSSRRLVESKARVPTSPGCGITSGLIGVDRPRRPGASSALAQRCSGQCGSQPLGRDLASRSPAAVVVALRARPT